MAASSAQAWPARRASRSARQRNRATRGASLTSDAQLIVLRHKLQEIGELLLGRRPLVGCQPAGEKVEVSAPLVDFDAGTVEWR